MNCPTCGSNQKFDKELFESLLMDIERCMERKGWELLPHGEELRDYIKWRVKDLE
jgi:hypothetical protein